MAHNEIRYRLIFEGANERGEKMVIEPLCAERDDWYIARPINQPPIKLGDNKK